MEKKIREIEERLDQHEARILRLEGDRGYIGYVDERVKEVRGRLKRRRESDVFLARMALVNFVMDAFVIVFLLAAWR